MEQCEILHSVKGYNDLYSINIKGEVYSWRSKKFLKPQKQRNGYLTVNLFNGKNVKTKTIHRLVAEVFIHNEFDKPFVNHKDLDKTNNHVNNLEWVTASENIQHANDNGIRLGERNGNSKLTAIQINEIRNKYSFRKLTYKELGEEYNVMKHYIARIVKRQVWKHI
jgi:hypothetical protein